MPRHTCSVIIPVLSAQLIQCSARCSCGSIPRSRPSQIADKHHKLAAEVRATQAPSTWSETLHWRHCPRARLCQARGYACPQHNRLEANRLHSASWKLSSKRGLVQWNRETSAMDAVWMAYCVVVLGHVQTRGEDAACSSRPGPHVCTRTTGISKPYLVSRVPYRATISHTNVHIVHQLSQSRSSSRHLLQQVMLYVLTLSSTGLASMSLCGHP